MFLVNGPMKKLYLSLLLVLVSLFLHADNLKLFYTAPARTWVEALPIGNSRFGAMVYGGVQREVLKLNEETFWAGGPHHNNSPQLRGKLGEIRSLIFNNRFGEAQGLIDKVAFTGQHGMRYLTLGALAIDFPGHVAAGDYHRQLDISNATATTQYKVNGVTYRRTVFASLADDVIIMHIEADSARALSFDVSYDRHDSMVEIDGSTLIMRCAGVEQEGIPAALRAECRVQVKSDGKHSATDSSIKVNAATKAVIYISAATNYVNYNDVSANESKRAAAILRRATKRKYDDALQAHVTAYKKQFDRVALSLPVSEASKAPTDVRVRNFANGKDKSLAALMFQYGRYLLISSSQPGGQPANLQGIWNESMNAPWDSKYTININTEMNYWPAEVTNLSETHEPLFSMVGDLSQTGATTARTLYGARGWVAHHNTDLWRVAGPVDAAYYGIT